MVNSPPRTRTQVSNNNARARQRHIIDVLTEQRWTEIKDKYGNRCLCCGRAGVKLTIDHVVPLVKGGLNSACNIQPLCKRCNEVKGDSIIDYRRPRNRRRRKLTT